MSIHKKKIRLLVGWVALLALLVGADAVISRHHLGPAKQEPVVATPKPASIESNWQQMLDHAVGPPRGNPHAAFTIVEFADFQCPQCGMVRPIIEAAMARAPINLYFVQCPIVTIHRYALGAAQAADSAEAMGKFWQMYDCLYTHQKDLSPEKVAQYAASIGLNGTQVANDVRTEKYIAQVWESMAFCTRIGISATPTIVVRNNGTGAVQIAIGRKQIAHLLNQGLAQLAKHHIK